MTDEALVDVRAVSKTFAIGHKTIDALSNVSLKVRAGEHVAIFGPSGAGKTTLLNLIAGIDRPTSGEILVLGNRLNDLDEEELAALRCSQIGYVFQDYNLISTLNARENLELVRELTGFRGADASQRITELLLKVSMFEREDHLPSQLSGGERQRLAFARALVNDPSIILADEPTGNLDEETARFTIDLLETMSAEDKAVITTTHDPQILKTASRRLMLRKGVLT